MTDGTTELLLEGSGDKEDHGPIMARMPSPQDRANPGSAPPIAAAAEGRAPSGSKVGNHKSRVEEDPDGVTELRPG